MNFARQIHQHCEQALREAFPEATDIPIEITQATQTKFGHYQLNSAMRLAKRLGKNPRDIAQQWVTALEHYDFYERIEIAGPGFINFTLKTQYLNQALDAHVTDPRCGIAKTKTPQKVIIDFSSPNIAKEMHVGHLRSTIIGDCIARTLEFLGHNVLRLNHVGDWGTQFGMLIAYLKEVLPDITQPNPPTVGLSDLVRWYRESKERFDTDPTFKKQAQHEVVSLQSGDPASQTAWKHICQISRQAYQVIYDRLSINITERGESFYNPWLAPLISELQDKGLLTSSDGAQCWYLDGFTNRDNEPLPLILQKSDGGFNYATTDLAALKHRVEVEHGNWLIYVTDAGQSLHFAMIFAAARQAGFAPHVKLDHVPFGLVLKPDGKKFKTRSGDTERLIDLIDTAIEKSKNQLQERAPELQGQELETAASILGVNAIKYADLSSNRLSNYVFSYDKMLNFEGNTAAFITYAYVRIQSIKRKVSTPNTLTHQLEEPTEIALGLLVCQFSETLALFEQELLPNRLTDYLYRLAEKFHEFFHHCRVEGTPQQHARVSLCESVAHVLEKGMELLGLTPLEKM